MAVEELNGSAGELSSSLLDDINSLLSDEGVNKLLAVNTSLSEKIAIANACRNQFVFDDDILMEELQLVLTKLQRASAKPNKQSTPQV